MAEAGHIILWGCCGATGDVEECDYVLCSACTKGYHIECLLASGKGESEERWTSAEWICPLCKLSRARGTTLTQRDNTPVRPKHGEAFRPLKRAALNSPPQVQADIVTLTREDVRDVVQVLLKNEMDNLFIKLVDYMKVTLDAELTPLRNNIKDLQVSMSSTKENYSNVVICQKETSQAITNLQQENLNLHRENRDLCLKLNQVERYARSCNVEIQCVPEVKSENVISIVTQIAKITNCDIKDKYILSCSRIAKMNAKSLRPRSIVVQFNSPRVRDMFLASCSKFNKLHVNDKLNSTHIGLNGQKTPIFIMEHLSSSGKALHAAARMKAKELGYKHVWVRNGRIYMRKTDTSDHKLIKDIESLSDIS